MKMETQEKINKSLDIFGAVYVIAAIIFGIAFSIMLLCR
jgi:hypothetical protein